MTHSFRDYCELEILITTGGPAARVVVQVDIDGQVVSADFQFQGWFQPWYSPEGQDHRMLTDWAGGNLVMDCRYCAEEAGRW